MSSRLRSPLPSARSSVHGARGHQVAVVDDADPVAHALGDFQDVGGEEDRRAAVRQLAQDVLDQAGGLGVEPDGGLVEDEDFGVVNQRGRERGLLLHAVAVGVDQVVAHIRQVEQAQELVNPVFHLGRRSCRTGRPRSAAARGPKA